MTKIVLSRAIICCCHQVRFAERSYPLKDKKLFYKEVLDSFMYIAIERGALQGIETCQQYRETNHLKGIRERGKPNTHT